ncbi:hypothetical protein KRX54_01075 [Actinomycetaceae bacterium TAE3-ERU4]|nr:hypothetical protein [Actinomycetaceae bacterium TAE3-ERU4]
MNTAVSLAEHAALTPRTVRIIENEEKDSFRADTLLRLDQALQWERGTSQNLLETGDVDSILTYDYTTDDEGNPDGIVYSTNGIEIESTDALDRHTSFTVSIQYETEVPLTSQMLIDFAHSLRQEGKKELLELQRSLSPEYDKKVTSPVFSQGVWDVARFPDEEQVPSPIPLRPVEDTEAVPSSVEKQQRLAASSYEPEDIPHAE